MIGSIKRFVQDRQLSKTTSCRILRTARFSSAMNVAFDFTRSHFIACPKDWDLACLDANGLCQWMTESVEHAIVIIFYGYASELRPVERSSRPQKRCWRIQERLAELLWCNEHGQLSLSRKWLAEEGLLSNKVPAIPSIFAEIYVSAECHLWQRSQHDSSHIKWRTKV